jgi:hypothetical protein
MLALMTLLACAPKDTDTTVDTADTDTSSTDSDVEGTIPAIVAEGSVTWTLEFDADAEAAGFTDCSYTRTFEGMQYLDMDYLCPSCDVQVQGTATMTEGLDCYSQISSAPEEQRTEGWGWSDEAFHRSGRAQYPLGELSTFDDGGEGTDIALAWSSESELTDGGVMLLSAVGTLRYQTDESLLLPDPTPTRTEPYACGWPQNDPGDLTIDYTLAVGQTFPNVYLKDQCGEILSLWDLYGSWLVLDTSQSDCGPCQSMADTAEAFVEDMADQGYDVKMVSLLGNGLSDPFGTPSQETLDWWVDSFSLTDPVLYDRGFAYALFPPFIASSSGESFGYPTWLVVNPQMELVTGNVGFGSWDDVGDVIRDAAR